MNLSFIIGLLAGPAFVLLGFPVLLAGFERRHRRRRELEYRAHPLRLTTVDDGPYRTAPPLPPVEKLLPEIGVLELRRARARLAAVLHAIDQELTELEDHNPGKKGTNTIGPL